MEMQRVGSYSKAYVEILEIINHMGDEYRNKIPSKLLNFFEENKDLNYSYNLEEIINNGNYMPLNETIGILAMIESKYWANDTEKELLDKALIENEKKYQDEIMKKYNPDNIFENKNKESIQEKEKVLSQEDKDVALVQKNDNMFVRIFNKLKNILHIK